MKEEKSLINTINKNDKQTHQKNGSFAKGNKLGGRTKGSKNKYTQVKEDIMWAFQAAGGKYRLRDVLIKGNTNQFLGAVSQIVKTLPREVPQVNTGDTHITYIWKGDKKKETDEGDSHRLRPSGLPAGGA